MKREAVIDAAELDDVKEALRRSCGVVLDAPLHATLRAAFAATARELGTTGPALLGRLREGDVSALVALVENAVVGETYFFRHPEQFALLRTVLARENPQGLRIWSAGCASGEEPYSLAMALLDAGSPTRDGQILATDVSERALERARAGVYGPWSLRQEAPAWASRYFSGTSMRVEVEPPVRALVRFARHNLCTEPPPDTGFDLVLCRNVLIYFDAPTVERVLATLTRAVRPGGLLMLSPVELSLATRYGLELHESAVGLLVRPPAEPVSPRATPPAPVRAPTPARAAAPSPPTVRRPPPPRAPAPPPPAPPPPEAPGPAGFDEAREAARRGEAALAERIALGAPPDDPRLPECFLLVSMAAEARNDLPAAVGALRKALYLEPRLAVAHAGLIPLLQRLGDRAGAERARRNAAAVLAELADDAVLRAVEPVTAGALRRALDGATSRGPRRAGS